MRPRQAVSGLLVIALAITLTGCAFGQAQRPVPPQPPLLEIELDDYDFAFDGPAPAGRLVIEASNVGDHPHELVLLQLPEGFSGDLEDLVGTGTTMLPIYSLDRLRPGESGRFAVDLEPGTYGLACFVEDEEGESHHEKGQVAELTVR